MVAVSSRPLVSSGFKAFGHHRIHAGAFRLAGKTYAGDYMHDGKTFGFEHGGKRSGIAGRGKDDLDTLLLHHFDGLVHLGIKHRHVDPERLVGEGLGFADMFPQQFGGHRARADKSQTSGLGNGSGQFCSTDPDHTALDDRIPDTEQFANRVFHRFSFFRFCQFISPAEAVSTRTSTACRDSTSRAVRQK